MRGVNGNFRHRPLPPIGVYLEPAAVGRRHRAGVQFKLFGPVGLDIVGIPLLDPDGEPPVQSVLAVEGLVDVADLRNLPEYVAAGVASWG